jgi:DNA polymerase III delta subunit
VGLPEVAEVVEPARKFAVFDLVEPIVDRRREVALQLVRRLFEKGESPIGMLGALAWLYRQLLVAQSLGPDAPFEKARRALSGPSDRIHQLLRQARRFAPEELRAAFVALHKADVALKSSPPDPKLIVEVLVAELAGARKPLTGEFT